MSLSIIRGIIKSVKAQARKLARFDASGRIGEEFSDREIFGQYGLQTNVPQGAECLLVRSGQNIYMIASDDRRYRIKLDDGEVALYDSHGNIIHLQKGGKISVEAKNEVHVKADKTVINSGDIRLGSGVLASGVIIANEAPFVCPNTGAIHHNSVSRHVKAT